MKKNINDQLSIKKLDITNLAAAQMVWNIQIPAYEMEANLIQFWDLPPLKETVQSLQQCGELFYGGFLRGELAGAISFKMTDDVLDIHRLMVHPDFFRRGIARAFIKFIEQLALSKKEIIVSTGSKNTPAIQLYNHCGFTEIEQVTVADGLSLTFFKKDIAVRREKERR
ncbi:GNAT family N-acetyltransferase [Bacillus aerolatus]|uniref:GNAT family N-acetyltransferase n=1 Tax=Bacillus aerolatus TaxID=2653354 RepID=A0A6I1FGS4_9BACI|nr:GNAT family N-acetyltransferase [Bacillus aerolatus]KAB7704737.1 GNAT family N-acetyltransferase [Bacillus aerolatus]